MDEGLQQTRADRLAAVPLCSKPVAEHRTASGWLRYGIDAPYVPLLLVVAGGVFAVAVVVGVMPAWAIVIAVSFFAQAAVYLHATLRGKHVAWRRLLDDLALRGDEDLLDVGCGHGAVLLVAARRLPDGQARGLDLWRSQDQSGNRLEATQANAEADGVAARVVLDTGDMTAMPYPDDRFDVVVSSLAVHNLSDPALRAQALDESLRVLRPGGRLVVVDIRHVGEYAAHLSAVGAVAVLERGLGPGVWFGGPWQATRVVTASSPVGAGAEG